jgi:hypothetical protein
METYTSLSSRTGKKFSRRKGASRFTADDRIDWLTRYARLGAETNRCLRRSKALLRAVGPSPLTRGELAW